MTYFTNNRIRWFISAVMAVLCGIAVFLPVINVADVSGVTQNEALSLVWFLSAAGFPEMYTVTLIGYFLLITPFIVVGFLKEFRTWSLIIAAVVSVVYFAINIFWSAIILGGSGYDGAVTLSFWGWLYLIVQTGTIINLFAFIPKIKR